MHNLTLNEHYVNGILGLKWGQNSHYMLTNMIQHINPKSYNARVSE